MKSIFSFTDYQKYLSEYFRHRKEKDRYFSYRFMSQRTGVDPGLLNKIIHGRMHLSVNKIAEVAGFCGLSDRQTEYFELMIKYGRATNPREIRRYFEKLSQFKRSAFYKLSRNQYLYYKNWYNSAIWSIMAIMDFSDNFQELAQMVNPPVTIHQARAAVRLLEDLGMIARNESGVYKVTQKRITTGEKWKSSVIEAYQLQTIRLAAQSIRRFSKEHRDISSVTISIAHEDLDEIRQRTREFRASLMEMKTGNTHTDSVYQVNVQIFPLSGTGSVKV
jgi:uncharacterized protein (TIGR02147 family)